MVFCSLWYRRVGGELKINDNDYKNIETFENWFDNDYNEKREGETLKDMKKRYECCIYLYYKQKDWVELEEMKNDYKLWKDKYKLWKEYSTHYDIITTFKKNYYIDEMEKHYNYILNLLDKDFTEYKGTGEIGYLTILNEENFGCADNEHIIEWDKDSDTNNDSDSE